MVRNYSYTGLAMIRVLHDSRYFCGVAETPKMQMLLLEQYWNECLKVKRASWYYKGTSLPGLGASYRLLGFFFYIHTCRYDLIDLLGLDQNPKNRVHFDFADPVSHILLHHKAKSKFYLPS